MGAVTDTMFLKLGGSLITDKTKPYTPRLDSLARLAGEIRSAFESVPDLRLVIGHGSGSFGHYAVKDALAPYPFPPPAETGAAGYRNYWRGFEEVWYRASQLNRYVVEALHTAGVPVIAFPPSGLARAEDGRIREWDISALTLALESGLVPVIYGDIAFDNTKGGTILSTEMLMFHLARRLRPKTILLAGLEQAVWEDFPARQHKVAKVTAATFDSVSGKIGGSHGTDVTGGMRSKVEEMLALVHEIPGVTVQIFSGEEPGNLQRAMKGEALGTLIARD